MMRRRPPTLAEVRRELVGDSRSREKLVARLVQLVRQDERDRVLRTMGRKRELASAETDR